MLLATKLDRLSTKISIASLIFAMPHYTARLLIISRPKSACKVQTSQLIAPISLLGHSLLSANQTKDLRWVYTCGFIVRFDAAFLQSLSVHWELKTHWPVILHSSAFSQFKTSLQIA